MIELHALIVLFSFASKIFCCVMSEFSYKEISYLAKVMVKVAAKFMLIFQFISHHQLIGQNCGHV